MGKTDKNMKIVCITVVFMMFILMLFPVFWIASSSFKGTSELFSYPPTMLPKNFTVENYTKAFKAGNCKAHRKAHKGNERGGKAA